jgi:predicted polyphosphate/ATP-dependent NAD kinase
MVFKSASKPRRIGFIVNPIAGMGGAVGLKGTDGRDVLMKAISLGAKPVAPARAESFLSELASFKGGLTLLVGAGAMGEDEASRIGLAHSVVGVKKEITSSEDTKNAVKQMRDLGVDLLVFCGGDGTARDVLDANLGSIPVLGVPTGVKMHSAVFAASPRSAAAIALKFLRCGLPLKEAEVMDVDEEAYREGRLSARLYGYLLTPYEPELLQGSKVESPAVESELHNQAAIALYVIEEMENDTIYIIGPGTTTRTIADLLDQEKTLLGVDLFCNKKLLLKDVNEAQIIEAIKGKNAKIIVTPIGGQGFIFGRGNLQISPRVIRLVGPENIIVIATRTKLRGLTRLRVDTGDPDLDKVLSGYRRVITDYREEQLLRVE